MKILFIGDVHLADEAHRPRMRKDNYAESIFEKLLQCADIAQSYDEVVFLGDVFHRKDPAKNSHQIVGRAIEVFRRFQTVPSRIPWVLVGNHDIRDGNMICLPEQPLGVVFRSGVLEELRGDTVVAGDMVGTRVQLSPLPFSYEAEFEPKLYECQRDPEADFTIRLTHAAILPPALPDKAYKMPHVSVDKVWGQKGWDILINGHIHHHSPVLQNGKQYFVNIGAVARGALNSWALEQSPRVLGVELVKGKEPVFTWHDLKVKPVEEVFRLDEAIRVKGQKAEIAQFVNTLQENEARVVFKARSVDFGVMLDEYLEGQKVQRQVAQKVKEYVGMK